ncbi:hypothetical protein T439DRAFT_329489 [Meredithblackwellia eburnea MCA 4105]
MSSQTSRSRPIQPQFELPKVELTYSNIQCLAFAAAQAALGYGLMTSPLEILDFLKPGTAWIEEKTKLAPIRVKGAEPLLATIGVLYMLLAFYTGMAVYTCDEKHKRNSVPGRLAFAVAVGYVCQKTP